MKFSKIVVSLILVLNVIFAAVIIAVFWHTGVEPTVLVACWFTFTTGELWAVAYKTKADKHDSKLEVS